MFQILTNEQRAFMMARWICAVAAVILADYLNHRGLLIVCSIYLFWQSGYMVARRLGEFME